MKSYFILIIQTQFWFLMSNLWEIGFVQVKIDGLVQERRNSSALPMELRLSCTNPSKCTLDHQKNCLILQGLEVYIRDTPSIPEHLYLSLKSENDRDALYDCLMEQPGVYEINVQCTVKSLI